MQKKRPPNNPLIVNAVGKAARLIYIYLSVEHVGDL